VPQVALARLVDFLANNGTPISLNAADGDPVDGPNDHGRQEAGRR
jgi:hypothetical protein